MYSKRTSILPLLSAGQPISGSDGTERLESAVPSPFPSYEALHGSADAIYRNASTCKELSPAHNFGTYGQFIEADTGYAQRLLFCKPSMRITVQFYTNGFLCEISPERKRGSHLGGGGFTCQMASHWPPKKDSWESNRLLRDLAVFGRASLTSNRCVYFAAPPSNGIRCGHVYLRSNSDSKTKTLFCLQFRAFAGPVFRKTVRPLKISPHFWIPGAASFV